MIELRLPAFALGPVPVVVAAFANQPNLQPGDRFLLTFGVGIHNLKRGGAVFIHHRLLDSAVGAIVVNLFQGKFRSDTRQRFGRPDRLPDDARDRSAAGLQQAGLQDHLQRRAALLPLAGGGDFCMSAIVQGGLHFIQAAGKVLFGNVAKLEARQRRHRIAQRTQEQFTLQRVAAGRRAVQIRPAHRKADIRSRRNRGILHREIQRHALRHKIFNVKIPLARLVVAGAGANVPHPGRRAAIERISQLIQAVNRFADRRTNNLAIRLHDFQLYRLLGERFTVTIAQ